MPNAAHPLFLLHVRPAQAAAAHELRARVKHAPVVDHNSLRNTMNTESGYKSKDVSALRQHHLSGRQLELHLHGRVIQEFVQSLKSIVNAFVSDGACDG